ncbi:MAG TPA: formate/nitrite transporter family protein [Tepidisphaeraceae bacterium]|jgi:formate/nitrite transporter FocA (FNT family)|nr:formate/nitrite transporter family protein [Tepidisphaeraceae bacterium]
MAAKKQQNDEEHEQADSVERAAPSGKVVHDAILKEGSEEVERPTAALFWSGLAAGLSMGFSLVAQGLLQIYLPDAHWRPLIVKLGYSVGFVFVVLGRQQLFTENTLTAVLPVLDRRDLSTLKNMFRLWGIVLLANWLGALAFGWASQTAAFSEEVRQAFSGFGREALSEGFGLTLWRAVFAGWLIALMVWLLPFAETARVGVIVMVTYLIGLGHFGHIVAGSVDVFSLAFSGGAGWGQVVGHFLVPVLLGNILGGLTMVTALNYGQVAAGK